MLLRALLLVLISTALWAAGCSRVLRAPFEVWPPYSFLGLDGRPAGLEVEMLAEVAKEAGCKVEWVMDLPRLRRWHYFRTGEIDILIAASDTVPALHKVAMFTRSYRPEVFSAFILGDGRMRPYLSSFQTMLNHRVPLVVQTGATIMPLYAEFAAADLFTRYEDYDKAILLLQHRRGEVLIGDRLAILHAAALRNVALKVLPLEVSSGPVSYMLGRKTMTEADLKLFDQAIMHLESNGTLERIRRRWLNHPLDGVGR